MVRTEIFLSQFSVKVLQIYQKKESCFCRNPPCLWVNPITFVCNMRISTLYISCTICFYYLYAFQWLSFLFRSSLIRWESFVTFDRKSQRVISQVFSLNLTHTLHIIPTFLWPPIVISCQLQFTSKIFKCLWTPC